MSHFHTRVSKELVEVCRSAMLHDNINIANIMVHVQKVEETRLMIKNREAKKVKSYDYGSSKSRLDSQYNPRFMKGFSNQVPSTFPKS